MERNIRRKEVRTKVESNQREDTSLQFDVQQEHAKDGCSTVVRKVNWDRMGSDGWISGWSEVCFHLGAARVTYWKHNMLDSAADSFAFPGKPGLRSISSEVTDSQK